MSRRAAGAEPTLTSPNVGSGSAISLRVMVVAVSGGPGIPVTCWPLPKVQPRATRDAPASMLQNGFPCRSTPVRSCPWRKRLCAETQNVEIELPDLNLGSRMREREKSVPGQKRKALRSMMTSGGRSDMSEKCQQQKPRMRDAPNKKPAEGRRRRRSDPV